MIKTDIYFNLVHLSRKLRCSTMTKDICLVHMYAMEHKNVSCVMCFSLESNYIWIRTHLQVFSHLAPLLYSSVVSQQSVERKDFKYNTIPIIEHS